MNEKLITQAALFARHAHREHKRKYTGEPYFNHLKEVADLCREAGLSAQAIAAAYLHDTIEDVGVTAADIEAHFGPRVKNLVVQLTDVSKPSDGNRATRKAIDLRHLAGATAEAQSVKLADLISNSINIVTHDPHFAKVYLREKEALLKVLTKGNSGLMAKAHKVLEDSKALLKVKGHG